MDFEKKALLSSFYAVRRSRLALEIATAIGLGVNHSAISKILLKRLYFVKDLLAIIRDLEYNNIIKNWRVKKC